MKSAKPAVRRPALMCAFLAFAVAVGTAQVTDKDLLTPDPNDFVLYSGTYDSQRHSLLKEINTSNVGTLQAKWIFHLTGAKDLEAPPIVYKGVMYVGQYNRVHALDAATGRLIWEYMRQPPSVGWQRGIGIYRDMVYMVAQDSALVALDRRTGNPLWEARPSQPGKRFQGPMPFAAKGLIIMSGSGQGGGFIEAFDALTGKPKWFWNTIPKPGEPGNETWMGDSWRNGGGPVWVSGSFDPQLNLIYWGTGQPSPGFRRRQPRRRQPLHRQHRRARHRHGKLKWHFQNTPHDVHDWDSNEMPVLLDAPFNGQPRKLLLQANRNGIYYILDRTNGRFLRGVPFVSKVDWMSGLSPEGRPILTPGHEPTVQGSEDVSFDRRRDQLAVPRVQPRHEIVLSDRAGRLRRDLSIDHELQAGAGRKRHGIHGERRRSRALAALRARDRCADREEGVGLRAGQLVPLRAGLAVDCRRSDLRTRTAGHVHRARCENRQSALEFQHRRADHRGAIDLHRRWPSICGALGVFERDRVRITRCQDRKAYDETSSVGSLLFARCSSRGSR